MGSVLDITRKKYKEIKSYNKAEMENFLSELYAGGVRDGFKNGLNTMIDIVGIGNINNWEADPYKGYETDKIIYGRGGSDQDWKH